MSIKQEIRDALKSGGIVDRYTHCTKKPLIYIAQPYGGKPENHAKAEQIALRLQQEYPQYTFISPVIAFGYAYNAFDYETGINICLDLLSRCDEIWVCYDDGQSKGVQIERQWAQEHGMAVKEYATLLDATGGEL